MSKIKIVLIGLFIFSLLLVQKVTGAEQVIPLNQLEKPGLLVVDEKRIYIPDGHAVKIFSRRDFSLQTTFGRKGEGPGEFKYPPSLFIRPDGIWVDSQDKLSQFSFSGKLVKEIKRSSRGSSFKPVGKGERFVGVKTKLTPEDFYLTYVIFNSALQEVKEIHRGKWILQKNRKRRVFEQFFYEVVGDKIVFVHYSSDFAIDIVDAEGKLIHSIRRDDKKIPFTKKDQQAVLDYWPQHPSYRRDVERLKRSTIFPEYFPAISTCRVANKKIYVITYLLQQGKSECLVYDMQGKFQKRIFIPLLKRTPHGIYDLPNFSIYDGRLFQVIDNPDKETWELHIDTIENKKLD